jgi:transcriptional regulator with XRE-family HTH domain
VIIIDISTCQSFFDRIDGIGIRGHIALMVTPAQCRAARGLLDWSQQHLAREAEIGIVTVRQVESGATQPRRATLMVLRQAFERAGVEFIDENGGGSGVRLRKRQRPKMPK